MTPPDSPSTSPPGGDRRVRRTRATLERVLLALVADRDLGDISVVDIADEAGVSRSTFYDHYRDVHELAEAATTSLVDRLIDSIPTPDPEVIERTGPTSLQAFFENLEGHASLYRSILGPQGSARVIDHVRGRIAQNVRVGIERELEHEPEREGAAMTTTAVYAAFTAGALIGVAADWVRRGCPGSAAEMADATWALLARQGDAV